MSSGWRNPKDGQRNVLNTSGNEEFPTKAVIGSESAAMWQSRDSKARFEVEVEKSPPK